jgi:hypothetical protein
MDDRDKHGCSVGDNTGNCLVEEKGKIFIENVDILA